MEATQAVSFTRVECYECGKELVPDAFPVHPAFPEFGGHEAGKVVDGQLWVRCPDGHRGMWVDAQ